MNVISKLKCGTIKKVTTTATTSKKNMSMRQTP